MKSSIEPGFDEDQNIIHWIGQVTSIGDEIKLSEQHALQSERLDSALSTTESVLWDWDIKSNQIYRSKTWKNLLGYDHEENKTLDFWKKIIHPDDLEISLDSLNNHLQGNSISYESIVRIKHKNGNWLWCHDSGRIIKRDIEGNPLRLIGIIQKYSPKKQWEIQLKESEKKKSILAEAAENLMELESMDDIYDYMVNTVYNYIDQKGAVVLTNYNSDYTKWEIKKLTGVPKHIQSLTKLLNQNLLNATGPINQIALEFVKTGKFHLNKNDYGDNIDSGSFKSKAKKKIIELMSLNRLYTIGLIKNQKLYGSLSILIFDKKFKPDGSLFEALVNLFTVAIERKTNELEILQSNQNLKNVNSELDLIMQSLSHDLRAPISTAMGLIGMKKDDPNSLNDSEFIQKLHKSIFKLDFITDDLLSMVFNKRTPIVKTDIDFKDIIEESIIEQDSTNNFAEIEWNKNIVQEVPFCSDKRRIRIILRNLLSNAIKYQNPSKTDKSIFIEVHCDLEKSILKIRDNGLGMNEDQQNKVFDFFYRANLNTEGIGLGLNIINRTVKKLEGKVEVISEPGIGTTFSVTIPNLK